MKNLINNLKISEKYINPFGFFTIWLLEKHNESNNRIGIAELDDGNIITGLLSKGELNSFDIEISRDDNFQPTSAKLFLDNKVGINNWYLDDSVNLCRTFLAA